MKIIQQIVKYLMIVLVSIIVGLNVYSLNAKVLLRDPLPMPFNKGIAIVMSGSMEPTLSVDDLVIVEKEEKYNIGDIVIYQTNNNLIIHRIIEIDDKEFIAKGDFNNTEDTKQDIDVIKGKMIVAIPKVGYIVYLLKKPVVTISLVVISLLLLEISYRSKEKEDQKEIEKLKKEINKLKNEKHT